MFELKEENKKVFEVRFVLICLCIWGIVVFVIKIK